MTEVLRSSAAHVRSIGIDALERVVTGVLGPGRRASGQQPVLRSSASLRGGPPAGGGAEQAGGGAPSTAELLAEQQGDVENMVLVALECIYREGAADEQVGNARGAKAGGGARSACGGGGGKGGVGVPGCCARGTARGAAPAWEAART